MLATALALALFQGPVVINEFSYDDSGTDDAEYVELFNPGSTATSIAGWRLEARNANGTANTYTMPATASVPARGYLVVGSSSGKVPNVGVPIGASNLFPNGGSYGGDGIFLVDRGGKVIDAVIYETNKGVWNGARPYLKGEGVWGNFTNIEAGFEMSWQLQRDGISFNNARSYHLRPWTPGKSNRLRPALPYRANFDNQKLGTDVQGWKGSFRHPKIIDPTVAGSENTNTIPASPQGKLAAIFWDNAGGGNAHVYLTDWMRDVVVEAYVYFDAKLELSGLSESWSLGVQGSTGTFYNQPEPENATGGLANGNTGVSATFRVTDKTATLYLIDHNDGGWGRAATTPARILGKIDLKAGVDDGWKRLRLTVSGNRAELLFGGTYGCGDGRRLEGTVSRPSFGGVYVGYREFIRDNKTARPFTCDDLQIRAPATSISFYGTAKATTVGTPAIGVNSIPVLGHQGFAVTGTSLVPNSPALFLLGAQKLNLDLGNVGGQRGAFLLQNPILIGGVAANARGEGQLTVPLPCTASLSGTNILWQILDLDPALRVRLPFGTSQGLETRLAQ